MTPPRRPQHMVRDLPIHQLRKSEEEQAVEQLNDRIRFYTDIGDVQRWGKYETRCEKCGVESRPNKTYCQGRDPKAGLEAKCYLVGEHLHCVCPACNFAWLERCKDDDTDDPKRGAPRRDEAVDDDGNVIYLTLPDVHERWGVPRPEPKKEEK